MLKLSELIFWIFCSLGGLRLLSLIGLPVPNTIFIIFGIFVLSQISKKRISYFGRVDYYILTALFFGCIGSLLSSLPLISFFLVVYIVAALYCSSLLVSIVKKISTSPRQSVGFVILSVINLVICIQQIFNPNFILVQHISADYTISSVSSLGQDFTFLPNFGRLSGIFIENGPMVSALIIINHYFYRLMVFRSSIDRNALKWSFFVSCFVFNTIIIIGTGSKLAIIYFLCLLLYSLNTPMISPLVKPFSPIARTLLSRCFPRYYSVLFCFVIVYIIFIGGFLLDNNSYLFEKISLMQSGLQRLAIPSFSILEGYGLTSTVSGSSISTLNGFFIYTQALGFVFGSLFLICILYFLLYPTYDYILLIILFSSLASSGSLLIINYSLIIFVSRLDPCANTR